jgi:hypothetical protein
MSVDIDDNDRQAIDNLQDISIICSKTTNPYLKVASAGGYRVVACGELAGYVWKHSKAQVEQVEQPSEVAAVS